MTKEDDVNPATVEARRAFQLIVQSERSLQEGRDSRDQAIIALRQQGLSLRGISALLREKAEADGLTEEQIADLGISYSAVNTVLQKWLSVEEYRKSLASETGAPEPKAQE